MRYRYVCAIVTTILASLAIAILASLYFLRDTTVMDVNEDDVLVRCVMEAVAARSNVKDLEERIGKTATLDTDRNDDWMVLQLVDIMLDPTEDSDVSDIKDIVDVNKVKRVVYWVRPVASKNPRTVGIVWTSDGEMKIFFGLVFPPR